MSDRSEELARAFHEEYRRQQAGSDDRPSMAPWEALAEEYKASSRRSARDLCAAAADLGYEVRSAENGRPGEAIPAAHVEALAERLHEQWVEERTGEGWRVGTVRDDARRLHPDLVAWSDLTDERREIDRHLVRELPSVLGSVGLVLARAD